MNVIDSFSKKYNATIWTQDADFDGLPQVKYYAKAK